MKITRRISLLGIVLIPWALTLAGITACVSLPPGKLCVNLNYKCYGDCHCDYYTVQLTVVDADMNPHIVEYQQHPGEVGTICVENLPTGKGVKYYVDVYCEGAKIHGNVSDFCSRRMQGMGDTGMRGDTGSEVTLDLLCV